MSDLVHLLIRHGETQIALNVKHPILLVVSCRAGSDSRTLRFRPLSSYWKPGEDSLGMSNS